MKAAVEAARWLGKADDGRRWQPEYDDFYAAFRRAAERDAQDRRPRQPLLPIRMRNDQNAVAAKGPVGLPARRLSRQGLRRRRSPGARATWPCSGPTSAKGWSAARAGSTPGSGTISARSTPTPGSGSARARRPPRRSIDFGNHASPLLAWREEQMPRGPRPRAICGDMPHNWASAEFIRLVRHLLVLERGDELHLFEGLPAAWIRPGTPTRVRGIADRVRSHLAGAAGRGRRSGGIVAPGPAAAEPGPQDRAAPGRLVGPVRHAGAAGRRNGRPADSTGKAVTKAALQASAATIIMSFCWKGRVGPGALAEPATSTSSSDGLACASLPPGGTRPYSSTHPTRSTHLHERTMKWQMKNAMN